MLVLFGPLPVKLSVNVGIGGIDLGNDDTGVVLFEPVRRLGNCGGTRADDESANAVEGVAPTLALSIEGAGRGGLGIGIWP